MTAQCNDIVRYKRRTYEPVGIHTKDGRSVPGIFAAFKRRELVSKFLYYILLVENELKIYLTSYNYSYILFDTKYGIKS